ncbi:MAG: PilN domain-containing protein [Xenococcus sp. MO_188.B8]|nr:PilN domain-containing protein [Xenococcus sp. MO_188.B8]
MFSLDINFLKDRGLDTAVATETKVERKSSSIADKIPIVAGAILALVLPGMVFSYSRTFEGKQAKLKQEIQDIEAAIKKSQGQEKSLENLGADLKQARSETQALIGVFEKIRPWSAILREVGDRTPPGTKIDSLEQNGIGANLKLKIGGTARSYSDVNDFVLFLQRSPFFDPNKIVLGTVNSVTWKLELENEDELPENMILTIPDGVKYTIEAQLANKPNSKLIRELNNKGALGLLTRLKTLENKGVITK